MHCTADAGNRPMMSIYGAQGVGKSYRRAESSVKKLERPLSPSLRTQRTQVSPLDMTAR
jgi:hypothetical protein